MKCALLLGIILLPVGILGHQSNSIAQAEKASKILIGAFKLKDLPLLRKITTSDFKILDKSKTYDKAAWIQITTQLFAMSKMISVDHQIISARLAKTGVIIRTKTAIKAVLTISGHKPQAIDSVSVDDETWVNLDGVWKWRLDNTISETTKVDGKVVKDPA